MEPIDKPIEPINEVMSRSKDDPNILDELKLFDYMDFRVSVGTANAHKKAHAETHRMIEEDTKTEPAVPYRIGWTKTSKKLLCLFELLYVAGYIDVETKNHDVDLIARHFRNGKKEYNKGSLRTRKSEMSTVGEKHAFISEMLEAFKKANDALYEAPRQEWRNIT